ncbi:MAG: hypothetical protein PHP42_04310 [Bacteroidota bacterium]|nr:hypothetical protein [Bacteroidota bacterium]
MDRSEFKKNSLVQNECDNRVVSGQTAGLSIRTDAGRRASNKSEKHKRMTNREYQNKHHRGSSPSRSAETGFTDVCAGHLPSEEWKNLIWYPGFSEPLRGILNNGTQSRNTPTDG